MTDNPQVMPPALQQLLGLLPQQGSAPLALVAVVGTTAGGVLWLAGSRFGQSFMALTLVAIGAWVGLHLPRWFSLPVQGWATATAAALLLGLGGFVFHRMWIGVGLALVLAFWAALASVATYGLGSWATFALADPSRSWIECLQQLWDALPPDLRRVGPLACGGALSVGLTIGLLFGRAANLVFHSALGVTLLVGFGLLSLALLRPQLLGLVPTTQTAQITTLAAMVLFGALAQWRLANAPQTPGRAPQTNQTL